jgi:DNA-binding response OmpR family regulator
MRILLVNEEPDLGMAIKQALNEQAYIVDWVRDGIQAQECLKNKFCQYTLAIFDCFVPRLSGVNLSKWLRRQNNPLPVLMLAKDRLADKIICLDSGADDVLVKPFEMLELLARLRALRRRSPHFQPRVLQVSNLSLDYGTRTASQQLLNGEKQRISLTKKEFQILEYFMKHPNQIVTSHQIMNQIWEMGAEPISNVVPAQMRLLRRKLCSGRSECLIETIYGMGYRFIASCTDRS